MDASELIRKEGSRRGYSLRTIKTYVGCVDKFFKYIKKEPRKVSKKDIREYLEMLIEKGRTGSTINVYLNALKFFMEEILNKRFMVKIKFSKKPGRLPIVLSKTEVAGILGRIKNKKHSLMIRLMYGAGLRVNELVCLRLDDLDLENNYGLVRHGKGNKDRLFIIPGSLKQELVEHIGNCKEEWLFNGYKGHMSVRSVQEILKRAAKGAGIKKKIHPHTLRHSYATHLIEDGYDVTTVQSLLGHSRIDTTMSYVHIAKPRMLNVRSPLDGLNIWEKSDYESQGNKENKPIC